MCYVIIPISFVGEGTSFETVTGYTAFKDALIAEDFQGFPQP